MALPVPTNSRNQSKSSRRFPLCPLDLPPSLGDLCLVWGTSGDLPLTQGPSDSQTLGMLGGLAGNHTGLWEHRWHLNQSGTFGSVISSKVFLGSQMELNLKDNRYLMMLIRNSNDACFSCLKNKFSSSRSLANVAKVPSDSCGPLSK